MSGDDQRDRLSHRTEEFLKLYGQCQRQLYVFTISLLPSATDAQDVLQETSLVLWEKYGQFDPAGSFFAWARGIAYRKVLQHREKMARQASFLRHTTVELLAKDLDRAEDDEEQDRQAALAHCLDRLSACDAELIKERYAPGATVQVLAMNLGRTPNALSQSLRRIRQALLDCMTRYLASQARGV